ncbi:MAG: enhanced serine sensitivity protein SseB C-terminal domain-containing protein [Chloroflexota bacterium]|nr:enhanced serine sensitivity protein SseB C-terminal domain-containing protein [Chloroflexota bacterium]
MNWFKKTFEKSVNAEVRKERDILFLGEQDGPPEQQLKARWQSILATFPDVLRAYLAIASFGQSENYQVVLCIWSKTGDNPLLVNALTQPFHEMFNAATPLDIMFLNAATEADLKKVCRAFYEVA